MKILGISGASRAFHSCRKASSSRIGSIAGIPLYDGDVEAAQGISAVVESLKRKTPEYKTLHAGGAEKRHGLAVAPAGGVFNEAGELADEAVRTQLQKYLAGFVAFIKG